MILVTFPVLVVVLCSALYALPVHRIREIEGLGFFEPTVEPLPAIAYEDYLNYVSDEDEGVVMRQEPNTAWHGYRYRIYSSEEDSSEENKSSRGHRAKEIRANRPSGLLEATFPLPLYDDDLNYDLNDGEGYLVKKDPNIAGHGHKYSDYSSEEDSSEESSQGHRAKEIRENRPSGLIEATVLPLPLSDDDLNYVFNNGEGYLVKKDPNTAWHGHKYADYSSEEDSSEEKTSTPALKGPIATEVEGKSKYRAQSDPKSTVDELHMITSLNYKKKSNFNK